MIVVSDTSGLSVLITVGHEDLLQKLFHQVLVPFAVERELRQFHQVLPTWVEVKGVQFVPAIDPWMAGLGEGEREAIVLAEETRADLLLMDERKGRRVATRKGLKVIGILGVLILAKQRGFLPKVQPVLRQMVEDARFHVSAQVMDAVLKQTGERGDGKRD
ncbi:MAG: DUF3368 domain-containing protein [Verrucomicrobia bacterium]|nr:DUF3368 domain-containing protein [Verrucomicrobiota bacterium]